MSDPESPAPFALLLRRYRQAAGLTQEALAERARLSWRAISDLEREVKRTPRRDTVVLLVEALALTGEARRTFETAASRSVVPRAEAGVGTGPPNWVLRTG